MYDQRSLDAAWDLVKPWSPADRQQLREEVPRLGFKARIGGRTTLDLAKECLELARAGLKRRNRRNADGSDEAIYLKPIEVFVERGITPAEELLGRFHGPWRGSVEPAFEEQEAGIGNREEQEADIRNREEQEAGIGNQASSGGK